MSLRVALVAIILLSAPVHGPNLAQAQGSSTTPTLVVTTTADSGTGSLRQALLDANSAAGALATITFNLPGAAPHRIAPLTDLPKATVPVTIDGTTQPGYAGAPIVELHGSDSLNVGLDLGYRSTVRALVVNGFLAAGIKLELGGNVVEGCYIGTDPTGTEAVSNWDSGIETFGGDRIGGTTPGAANLVSANGGSRHIGGGIFVHGPNTLIQGNAIGTDVTRTKPLGNGGPGVRTLNTAGVVIGGIDPAAANVIAFNLGPGVFTRFGRGVSVLGNSIYANTALFVGNFDGKYGIHDDFGVQCPAPTLTFVSEGATTHVKGAVTFQNLALYGFGTVRFELFRNVDCSEEGFGQGKEFLGAVEGERTAANLVTFETDLPIHLGAGETLTCTATSPDGSTSAFSNCLDDTGGCELPFVTNEEQRTFVEDGDDATLEAKITGSEPLTYQWYARDENLNFVAVPGATARTFIARHVTESTDFEVTASNGCASTFGYFAVAVCSGPPVIEKQPEDYTSVRGNFGRLEVDIPFGTFATYQWFEGRRGDTSSPVDSPYASLNGFVIPVTTVSGRFWCRVSNACGAVDSNDAAITVVAPMEITSVVVKGSGAKAKIVATGSSIPADVLVFVPVTGGAVSFAKAPKVAGGTKITQKGKTVDGRGIDEAVPRGVTTTITFSSSRGDVSVDVARP